MEKGYFINGGIPNPTLQFEPTMPFPLHSGQSFDCLFNPIWDHSTDQFNQFDSTLNSIVSSPAEVIGKLGTVCNFIETNNNSSSTNNSCYSTPGKDNIPNLGSSVPPPLPALSTDPGFARRAAKFSCFGSRSVNGRTSPLGLNNAEFSHRSAQPLGNGKLPRVSSSSSLKQAGSPLQIKNSGQTRMEMKSANGLALGSDKNLGKISSPATNSNESVSEPSGETGSKPPTELNSRKSKTVSRGEKTEDSLNGNMGGEADDSARAKRCKLVEGNGTENGTVTMDESKGNEIQKQAIDNQKPPEPPKDYIHVRARRGQATDSHSLAERVRREKISERMKLLQDLVPGCNKVTGKALMLDEIINYVQSLQRQVEFLSMKFASVNPSLDFPVEPNGSLPQPVSPVDKTAASAFPSYQQHFVQFPALCEDDLQSIVQMGFSKNPNKTLTQGFPGPQQTSHTKIEM